MPMGTSVRNEGKVAQVVERTPGLVGGGVVQSNEPKNTFRFWPSARPRGTHTLQSVSVWRD